MGTQCGFWWWRALEASPQNRWTCFQHEDVSFFLSLSRQECQVIYLTQISASSRDNSDDISGNDWARRMDQQAGSHHCTPQSIYGQGQARFFIVDLHLYGVALVLSLNFGTLCIWNVSVMGFRRHEWGRGHEFHGSNSRSCRDYYCETHASWLGAQTSP